MTRTPAPRATTDTADKPDRRRTPLPADATARLAAYTAALAEADLSAGTRNTYASRVREYLAWLATTGPADGRDPLEDPHGRDYAVRDFRTHLKAARGAKPTTVNNYIAALDHFYAYHLGLGRVSIDRERLARWAPRALDPAERKAFLRAVERCGSVRDTAICLTLYFSGLRISELAALDLRDVRLTARRTKLIVRNGKGQVYREIPGLHRTARTALEAWLEQRPTWLPHGSKNKALLLGRRGNRLAVRTLRDIVTAIAEDANIEASPHDLRHTLATMMREQGHDLTVIKEVLGHESIETTARYTIPSEAEAADALESLDVDH
jgi:site-specific recombinase XerD